METRIVEWVSKASNNSIMMRIQLINNSNSPIIVSHLEISDSEDNEMIAADYSHVMFFRKIEDEKYDEPIKSTQFPVTLLPHSGQNVCLIFVRKNNRCQLTNIKTGTTNILLDTNKGLKKLHPTKVVTELSNIQFFS